MPTEKATTEKGKRKIRREMLTPYQMSLVQTAFGVSSSTTSEPLREALLRPQEALEHRPNDRRGRSRLSGVRDRADPSVGRFGSINYSRRVRAGIGDERQPSPKEQIAMMPAQILKVLSQGHDRSPGETLEAATAQRSTAVSRAETDALEGELDRSALLRIFAGHAFGESFARRKGAVDLVGTGETGFAPGAAISRRLSATLCRQGDELQAFAGVQELIRG